jgi:mono/diheme cytochrome c family protein
LSAVGGALNSWTRPALCATAVWMALALLPGPLIAHDPKPDPGAAARPPGAAPHSHEAEGDAHVHPPVPPEYQSTHVPAAAWTNPRLLARGREIYVTRCSVCHGEDGDGQGPAAAGLPIKPPSFRDEKMVGEMAGNYWFWRVSEGGLVEPFRSMGSVMPAWKDELSVQDRWAVIAYSHSLSGHRGPHVVSEHPQMLGSGQAGQRPAGTASPPGMQGGSAAGSHRH